MRNLILQILFLVCLAAGFLLIAYTQFQVNSHKERRVESHILWNQAAGQSCNQLQKSEGAVHEN
jgi:hypothetical protein